MHWQSEKGKESQMQELDVSELLDEGKLILMWEMLFSKAGGSERVCREDKWIGGISNNKEVLQLFDKRAQMNRKTKSESFLFLLLIHLWLMRGSGVRDTLRNGLPQCEGDCCLRWLDGDMEDSKRLCGLGEPLTLRLRFAGDGERRPTALTGDRGSLPGRAEGNIGLLLCLGGEEDGDARLLGAGELLRLGDLEGRRLASGEERFAGELDIFLFCVGKGEGL